MPSTFSAFSEINVGKRIAVDGDDEENRSLLGKNQRSHHSSSHDAVLPSAPSLERYANDVMHDTAVAEGNQSMHSGLTFWVWSVLAAGSLGCVGAAVYLAMEIPSLSLFWGIPLYQWLIFFGLLSPIWYLPRLLIFSLSVVIAATVSSPEKRTKAMYDITRCRSHAVRAARSFAYLQLVRLTFFYGTSAERNSWYQLAEKIWWCVSLFLLANLIRAVITRTLSHYFTSKKQAERMKEAIHKEHILEQLSKARPISSRSPPRVSTTNKLASNTSPIHTAVHSLSPRNTVPPIEENSTGGKRTWKTIVRAIKLARMNQAGGKGKGGRSREAAGGANGEEEESENADMQANMVQMERRLVSNKLYDPSDESDANLTKQAKKLAIVIFVNLTGSSPATLPHIHSEANLPVLDPPTTTSSDIQPPAHNPDTATHTQRQPGSGGCATTPTTVHGSGAGSVGLVSGSSGARTHLLCADMQRVLGAEEGAKVFELFESDASGHVSLTRLSEGIQRIFLERKRLSITLKDTSSVLGKVGMICGVIIHTIFALIYLTVFEVQIHKLWITLSSVALAFAFVFGNSIRNIYESVLFLLVMQPFDVGDWLMLEKGDMMQVTHISLLGTMLQRVDGRPVYYPNQKLMAEPFSNVSRGEAHREFSFLHIDLDTTGTMLEEAERGLKVFLGSMPREYTGKCFILARTVENPLKLRVMVMWEYTHNGEDVVRTHLYRSKALVALAAAMKFAGVRYSWPAQEAPEIAQHAMSGEMMFGGQEFGAALRTML